MRFEKLVRELVLTSSPSTIGPIWVASLPSVLRSPCPCILPSRSSSSLLSADAQLGLSCCSVRLQRHLQTPSLLIVVHGTEQHRQRALRLLPTRPGIGEQRLLNTLDPPGCCPAALLGSSAGGTWGTSQQGTAA